LVFGLRESWVYRGVAVAVFALALLGVGINARADVLRVEFAKGLPEDVKLFEKWNHFSRVAVFGDQEAPFLWMNIDALAGTPIPRFHGTPEQVEYSRQDAMAVGYEIAYLAYHLREGGKALIIGPGGGLDVVAALAFGQREVTAVEINPLIIDAVNDRFAGYSGSLYALPRVRTVIDEGRSYVASSAERYDVIQASMTDTWAATGAGAFSLSENYLYTEEAFADYYRHLTDDGILTITRWYFESLPAEMFRLVGLAHSALEQVGVSSAEQHIVVAAHDRPEGFGVLMLKRTPFTASEIAALEALAPPLDMILLYAPGVQGNSEFFELITADNLDAYYAAYPLNIAPPTDNNPFFFHLLRPNDFLNSDSELLDQGAMNMNLTAVSVLINLLILISILTVLFVLGPLFVARRRDLAGGGSRAMLLVYFAGLGLGFMTIEISLMQRFILFLGHPIYSLTVILFSLLFFAGLGSLTTNRIQVSSGRRVAWIVFILIVLLTFYVFALPGILHGALEWPRATKVVLSIALLAPLGYLMGMPFPLGIKLAGANAPRMVPWLWGINGTLSVLASALSVFLALNLGFTFAALVGQAAYVVAFLAVLLGSRRRVSDGRVEEGRELAL
jgi:spermidine synthase